LPKLVLNLDPSDPSLPKSLEPGNIFLNSIA
jgi:hypothetical protein